MNKAFLIFSAALLLCAAPAAQAQLFGPSDEEKQHETDQDSQLTNLAGQNQQLQGRVQALEDQTRNLTQSLSQATGTSEDLRHQVDLLSQKLDQQQKEFAYRLCMVSAQQLGAGGGDQGLNCAGTGAPNTAGAAPPPGPGGLQAGAALPPIGSDNGPQTAMAPPVAPPMVRPPGNLGTLNTDEVAQRPVANQFDSAMNFLAKAQYDEAKASFRAYADANPDDTDLSPQAIYWVGNIDFTQHDYQGAMVAFTEQIKKYPKSSRGPESMLKLGQSLLAVGRTQDGCTTLGAIKTRYPQASPQTLALATGARRTSCSK